MANNQSKILKENSKTKPNKQYGNRKFVISLLLSFIGVIIILALLESYLNGDFKTEKSVDLSKYEASSTETQQEQPKPVKKPDYEKLGSFLYLSQYWTAIAINPEMSKSKLVEIARTLHNENPDTRFAILDAKPSNYSLWHKAYTQYPDYKNSTIEAWNDKHYIAIIQSMYNSGWQLYPMYANNNHFKGLEPTDL